MSRLEFPLAQGWAKNLVLAFEDRESSQNADLNSYLQVKQVHGRQIYQASPKDLSSDLTKPGPLAEADGIYVQGEWLKDGGKGLLIKTADCIPLFLIDGESHAIVSIHAGWRGLQQKIHFVPFEKKWLNPKTTWAWVGPSLSGDNFSVREDMWSQFDLKIQRNEKYFRPTPDPLERKFFAWDLLEDDLKSLGVELVYNVGVNTLSDESFSSYRRNTLAGLTGVVASNYSWAKFT